MKRYLLALYLLLAVVCNAQDQFNQVNLNDQEITFKPKFSITKNITFSSQTKIANKLAKAFKRFKPFNLLYLTYIFKLI